jgi:RNA polymerase sigma factor (sigma-70 family)
MFLESEYDALVDRVVAGDTDALGTLLEKWQAPLMSFISKRVGNKHDVEEISQKVMMNIINAMQKGNPPHTSFQNWAYKIAQNAIASHYRKEVPTTLEEPEEAMISSSGKKMGRVGLPLPDPEDTGGPAEKAEEKEEKNAIIQIIQDWEQGSPHERKQAAIFTMRFFDQMELSKIAAELDIPLGTVKRIIHFGKKNLARDLRKRGIEE